MTKTDFDYEASWALKEAPVDSKESERIRQTIAMIPEGVRTVLDAGCGDGRVSASLATRYDVVGIDVSSNAIGRQERRRRVVGSLAALPFPDRSFDLVMSSEVIEHIPGDVLGQVLGELRRVSREYVLVTVPYLETLEDVSVRCRCGFVFHKWGHLRRFDEEKLASLYPDLTARTIAYLGKSKPADPAVLKKIRQNWGGRYGEPDADTICPECGGRTFNPGNDNFISALCDRAQFVAGRILPRRRATWIGAVFAKSPVR
jgi:ubiquinone/menaquinone biosynthesis C-methylase UbiE